MKRFRIWLLNLHTDTQKPYKQDPNNPMAFCPYPTNKYYYLAIR